MNLRAISLVALPVVLSCMLAACGPAGDGRGDADPTVLRRGNGGDPQTLDPARAEDVHSFNVLADLYEGLVALDAGGNIVAGVAASWNRSADGLVHTFLLRDDARWSDGAPVVAADFVAGMRRSVSPETGSGYSFMLYPIRNAEAIARGELPVTALGVAAPDERTLIIELQSPAPYFYSVLTMPIAYPLAAAADDSGTRFSDPGHFVGNGPFLLDAWEPGSFIRLRKNPAYREADAVAFDEVVYLAVAEPATELNMYRAGELDITFTVPGSQLQRLRESHSAELRIVPNLTLYYLAFDMSEAPLDDAALRKALSMAIDRDTVVQVTGRGEQPAYGIVPDGVAGYEPARFPWMTLTPEQRHAEARELYAQAGYSRETPLELTLLYDAGDLHETIALAIAAMWRDTLGVDVVLDKREWKYFLATRDDREDWQVMRFAWSGDYDHPATFMELMRSGSPMNLSAYVSERFDRLLADAEIASAPGEQMRRYREAEAAALDDNPIAPLYFFVSKHLVAPGITGFEDNALDRHPSRYLARQAGAR